MKRAKFEKLIDSTPDIPTLPAVATRVLEVVRHPESGAADLRDIVQHDPVLSSKVLRMANSAYFGLPDELTDLQRAIALLGFNSVRNLAFTACLQSLYRPEFRCGAFTASSLWMHSVSVAVIARLLAARLWPGHDDEAFLAGLVHDVGIIIEWNLLPDPFERVIRTYEGTGKIFTEVEKQTLGFHHCACGAAIIRRWKLPRHLVHVAKHHHGERRTGSMPDPANGSPADRLTAAVHLAECICAERGNGFFDEPRDDDKTAALLTSAGCQYGDYREIVDATDAELQRARTILSL